MKKLFLPLLLIVPLAGCTQTQTGAVVGGASGAAIGSAVAAPGARTEGALIGAAIGATAGALIGRASEDNQCRYRDRRTGRIYVERCPAGY